MRARILANSEKVEVVAFADASTDLPSVANPRDFYAALERLARDRRVFGLYSEFIQFNDDYPIDLFVDEEPTEELRRLFQSPGESFGLTLPTGRLGVFEWRRGAPVMIQCFETRPGEHRVAAFAELELCTPQYDAEGTRLLSEDWKHLERVERIGQVGCLVSLVPLGLLAGALIWGRWDWGLPLVVAAACWIPYALLSRSKRVKRAQRQLNEHFGQAAARLVIVTPAEQADLPGGYFRGGM